MQPLQADYFAAYRNLRLSRDDKGVLVAEFHSNGGPFIMNAQARTEFVDAFHRIGQDRANKIVIVTGAGGNFIGDVEWPSFGNVADPGIWSRIHDEGAALLRSFPLKIFGRNAILAPGWLRMATSCQSGIKPNEKCPELKAVTAEQIAAALAAANADLKQIGLRASPGRWRWLGLSISRSVRNRLWYDPAEAACPAAPRGLAASYPSVPKRRCVVTSGGFPSSLP